MDGVTTGIPGPGDSGPSPTVRVFISSTFHDMQEERDVLARTTFPALRERFRARGVEILDVDLRRGVEVTDVTPAASLAEVERCKPWFIAILGQCYGTPLTGQEATPELQEAFPALRGSAGRSLTEIEILQGALAHPGPATHALFFERDPAWLDTQDSTQRARLEDSSLDARAKLAELKASIRSAAPLLRYESPAQIGPLVEAALGSLLEAHFPVADEPDDFTAAHRVHAACARDRLHAAYVGGAPPLGQLDRWAAEPGAPPLLITGAAGIGKSALLAHWLQARCRQHPDDLLFGHHLGATPDSAHPVLMMWRLWEHLNRATDEQPQPPALDAPLADWGPRLALRVAQAAARAGQRGATIVIALDGLDRLAAEEQGLRWLPELLAPNVKLLATTQAGVAQEAGLARGWRTLEITPLAAAARRELIAATLRRRGGRVSSQSMTRLLGAPLAGLPLFLTTVLESLRVPATDAQLDARLESLLSSADLPGLFARWLERLERDCGEPLVRQAASLIWASRAGIEESEIIQATGATALAWSRLRGALGEAVRSQMGRIAFSHDALGDAVQARYLATPERRTETHLALAARFAARRPDLRQAQELPYQLRAAGAWERLEATLLDLDRLRLPGARGPVELLGHWLALEGRGRRREQLLCDALQARAGTPEQWTPADLDVALALGDFLRLSGVHGDALRSLCEGCASAARRLLGEEHPQTLRSLQGLADTVLGQGHLAEAAALHERLVAVRARVHGPDDRATLAGRNTLAETLSRLGRWTRAQELLERVVEESSRVLGPEHPDTLARVGNLAVILANRRQLHRARTLQVTLLDTQTRVLGRDHPQTLRTLGDLAVTLNLLNDAEGAQRLQEQRVDSATRRLGAGHPFCLASRGHLAMTLSERGDHVTAQRMLRSLLTTYLRRAGAGHPDTIGAATQLSKVLLDSGDIDAAQELQQAVTDSLRAARDTLPARHPIVVAAFKVQASIASARALRNLWPFGSRAVPG